jgi:hypothetical protein
VVNALGKWCCIVIIGIQAGLFQKKYGKRSGVAGGRRKKASAVRRWLVRSEGESSEVFFWSFRSGYLWHAAALGSRHVDNRGVDLTGEYEGEEPGDDVFDAVFHGYCCGGFQSRMRIKKTKKREN